MTDKIDTAKLVADFLANGGKITHMVRGQRSEIVTPLIKRRGYMGKKKKTED